MKRRNSLLNCCAGFLGSVSVTVTTVPTSEAADVTVNRSSFVIRGGEFQPVLPVNGTRKSVIFQNICSIGKNCTSVKNNCFLFLGSAISKPTKEQSILVPPGVIYSRTVGSIPADQVQVTCDGTGDSFLLLEAASS